MSLSAETHFTEYPRASMQAENALLKVSEAF